MNADEAGRILARIQLDDNREIDGEGIVLRSWIEKIGDLPFDLAYEAVLMHSRESTAYLTAGHIRANVKLLTARLAAAERVARAKNRAILPRQITLDRAKFEAETQASIREHRIARGVDPETGKPVAP
ncbi:hypothetical protein [Cryobacterium aureum]|uniref:hypothetical protein n=1 Tax=Cryobacterium aureum TaxID=995037 RepID=UPI000CF4E72E|nr:hypothetical protein [Cryobacterium aureum]